MTEPIPEPIPVTVVPDPATTVSPKVIASTLGSLIASAVVGIILAIQASPQVLGGLPPVALFLIVALLPTAVTFLSGYVKSDPARTGSGPA